MPTAPSWATIKLKRNLVTGYVPTTAQLQQGELAVNVADGLLFLKRVSGGNEQIYGFMPMQLHPLVSLSSARSAGLSLDGQELGVADGYAIPDSAKVSNWDTAYGWGNHASAGYLTSQPLVGRIGRYLLQFGKCWHRDLCADICIAHRGECNVP